MYITIVFVYRRLSLQSYNCTVLTIIYKFQSTITRSSHLAHYTHWLKIKNIGSQSIPLTETDCDQFTLFR